MALREEQKLLQQVITEAWDNDTFKENLKVSPVEAIENLTGQKLDLPEGKRLIVRDQTDPNTIYINIPAEPDLEDMELNEEQLEAVAGGMDLMRLYIEQFPILRTKPIIPGDEKAPNLFTNGRNE